MKYAVITLFSIILLFLIFMSSYHKTPKFSKEDYMSSLIPLEEKNPETNLILYWTKYFGGDFPSHPTWIPSSKYPGCFNACRITSDRRYLAVSDAVIFHSRDLRKDGMPPLRTSQQIYIYVQQESPPNTKPNLKEYDNVFNWTMTYRQDSDIYHPYFRVHPLTAMERAESLHKLSLSRQELQKKTKLVAWVVSNCHTVGKRENYVNELKKFISVDIYGACGSYPCSRKGEGCFPAISEQYKFYLSFENSLCVDYITEKFWQILKYDLVPVVYGGADYDQGAPPGSFINTQDFNSPKALAEYLMELDNDPNKYLTYFRWKTKYKIEIGDGWCSLCKRLTEQKRKPAEKSYANLHHWWNNAFYTTSHLETNWTVHEPLTNANVDVVPACSSPPLLSNAINI